MIVTAFNNNLYIYIQYIIWKFLLDGKKKKKKMFLQIEKNFDSDIYQSLKGISDNDVTPMNSLFVD